MAEAKKTTKKKVAAPLYVNGRYVVEKQLPEKPKKGAKPYAKAKGSQIGRASCRERV